MQYRLLDSLGLDDARKCNKEFGASLTIDAEELAKGEIIDLNSNSAAYLTKRYPALLEPANKIKGVAQEPGITAPEQGSVTKATKDLERYRKTGSTK